MTPLKINEKREVPKWDGSAIGGALSASAAILQVLCRGADALCISAARR